MEQEFRTTFIPKKPVATAPVSSRGSGGGPTGILFTLGLLILIITVALAGGVYFFEKVENEKTITLQNKIKELERTLETNVIQEFNVLDKRFRNADTLLKQHAVFYPIFRILESSALPEVRFTKLDISLNESGDVIANLSGESDGYRSIALQSQALSKNKALKNIIFSNFVVTPRSLVSFDMSFTVTKSDLIYAKYIIETPAVTEYKIDNTGVQDVDTGFAGDQDVSVEKNSPDIDGLNF